MVHIEPRDDDWYEAGKDDEKSFPVAYKIYLAKQQIKEFLESIGEQPTLEDLAEKLSEMPEFEYEFSGIPYIQGNRVFIETHGLPGRCYLGEVV